MGRGHVVGLCVLAVVGACSFEIRRSGSVPDAPDIDGPPDVAIVPSLVSSINLFSAPTIPLGVAFSPAFDPKVTAYAAPVSVFRRSVIISVVPIEATTTITIAGVPAASGVESAPIALVPGANQIAIVARALDGIEMTYTVDVARNQVTQEAYIKASDTASSDFFGNAIAMSGDTLVVGAPFDDDTQSTSGAAYVFLRIGSTWTQQARLKASNIGDGDQFGLSVAISGDTIAVGAFGEDSNATGSNGNQSDNSRGNSGAVYVFTRSSAVWTQQAYIKASNPGTNDTFGYWVSLDADTLAVGSPLEDSNATGINGNQGDNSASDSGAVYMFRRTGTSWSQQAYIKASNTGFNDTLGFNLVVHGDTLVVGAEQEDSAATGSGGDQADNTALESGAAYVFTRTGTTWSQQAYLKASNTGAGDGFGDSFALAGNVLVIGARKEDSAALGVDGDSANNSALESGAAYVFRRVGTTWSQQSYLKPWNTEAGDEWGISAGISGDLILIGSGAEDGSAMGTGGDVSSNGAIDSGAVYVFGETATSWAPLAYVKASNTGAGDGFGFLFAVTNDTLVVGATGEDSAALGIGGSQVDNTASESGAAYGFR